jgi:hypothetical protein
MHVPQRHNFLFVKAYSWGFLRLKGLARMGGMSDDTVSGHSLRVGMAQDLVAANLDIASVMQAGGWRSPTMVARYTEKLTAQRGAVARFYRG